MWNPANQAIARDPRFEAYIGVQEFLLKTTLKLNKMLAFISNRAGPHLEKGLLKSSVNHLHANLLLGTFLFHCQGIQRMLLYYTQKLLKWCTSVRGSSRYHHLERHMIMSKLGIALSSHVQLRIHLPAFTTNTHANPATITHSHSTMCMCVCVCVHVHKRGFDIFHYQSNRYVACTHPYLCAYSQSDTSMRLCSYLV